MIPSPLNLARMQDARNGVYAFQHHPDSQRQSDGGPGPPGLQISLLEGEPAAQPTVLSASASSPAVLTNKQSASAVPIQDVPKILRPGPADGWPRRPLSVLEPPPQGIPQGPWNEPPPRKKPQQEPPSRDIRHDILSGDENSSRERSYSRQPATRTRSSLQSPRRRPRGPRPQGTWLPTILDDNRAASENRTERLAQLGPATSKSSHESMAGPHTGAQRSLDSFVPRPETTQTHTVLIEETELMDLVASGILKINPESNPPPWLLTDGNGELVPAGLSLSPPVQQYYNDVEILENAERKPVTITESPESVKRNKSHRVQVEGVVVSGHRGPSGDSGYCTASPVVPHSASMSQLSKRHNNNEPRFWETTSPWSLHRRQVFSPAKRSFNLFSGHERVSEMDSWSLRSRAEQQRLLRRRSSAPSLGAQFRRAWEDEGEDDADDENSRPPSRDSGWEDSWLPETVEKIISDRPGSGSNIGSGVQHGR